MKIDIGTLFIIIVICLIVGGIICGIFSVKNWNKIIEKLCLEKGLSFESGNFINFAKCYEYKDGFIKNYKLVKIDNKYYLEG